MWINKKKYENLKKVERKYKELQENLVSFSDYYTEKLEQLKKKFPFCSDKHRIVITFNSGDTKVICYNCLTEAEKDFDQLRDDMMKAFSASIQIKDKISINRNDVKCVELVFAKHPEPYTDEEIEAWAKEQLEKEMQEWKVVKPAEDEIKDKEQLETMKKYYEALKLVNYPVPYYRLFTGEKPED